MASIIHFQQAVRAGDRLLIGIYGMSGGGKTKSSLLLAKGLAGGDMKKVFVIDTEEARARVFADDPVVGGFMWGPLSPPFTPERYVEALDAAEQQGAEVVIIDSGSHEWSGEGGVLDLALAEESRGKKGLGVWAVPKAKHKRFVRRLLRSRAHVILCLRAKDKFEIRRVEKDGRGQDVPVHLGYTQEQDPRLIFESTVQLFLPHLDEHGMPSKLRGVPMVEKCPDTLRPAFPDGRQITVATGEALARWAQGTAPADPALVLRRAGEAEAEKGMAAYRAWWDKLSAKQKREVKVYSDALKAVAAEADAQRASQQQEGAA